MTSIHPLPPRTFHRSSLTPSLTHANSSALSISFHPALASNYNHVSYILIDDEQSSTVSKIKNHPLVQTMKHLLQTDFHPSEPSNKTIQNPLNPRGAMGIPGLSFLAYASSLKNRPSQEICLVIVRIRYWNESVAICPEIPMGLLHIGLRVIYIFASLFLQ